MRPFALAIILASPAVLAADILHLRDGSRHYGQLISRDERVVVFRVFSRDGQAAIVREFDARLVASVQRSPSGGCGLASQPADRPAQRPRVHGRGAWPEPDETGLTSGERAEQMLREGFELADDQDWPAALRAVQRAVLEVDAADLAALELLCTRVRGVALPDFLAELRIRVASTAEDGRAFRLRWATPYEREALGRRLRELETELLASRSDGRALREWVAESERYTQILPESRRLAADAARAAAVIDARLRLDPWLIDRGERAARSELHDRLAALASRIMGLPGFSARAVEDAGDPAAVAAQKLAADSTTRPSGRGPAGRVGAEEQRK